MRTLWSCSAVFASLVLFGACSAEIEGSDGQGGAGGGPAGAPGKGGSQSANGGSQSANGGSQSANGGSQSANGGSQSTNGGSQSTNGGSQSTNGGSPSAGGSGGSAQGMGGQAPSSGGAPAAGSGGAAAGGSGSGGRGGSSAVGGSAGAGRGGAAAGGASAGSGGKASGGSAGSTGGTASGGAGGGSTTCTPWPTAKSTESLTATKSILGVFDGQFKRYIGAGELGTAGQDESQGALIEIEPNGTLRNVIIGSPAADGIHCKGACTLENVWWEDVGEDAATFRGSSASQQMTVRCGGAKGADDKVFQHNGAGTLTIQNFTVESFGKLYRSCGNCESQYARHVVLQDVTARTGKTLVGLNTNYGDTAKLSRITLYGSMTICERYTGNSSGDEPVKTGTGPDSTHCLYQTSDITQR